MTPTERDRIARAANALRPDWPIQSVATFLWQNLKHHAYADVAVAIAAVATDPLTETPRRVLEQGPWWKATQFLGGASSSVIPGHPQCEIHKRCPNHDFHPIGADKCPDCKQSLVTDPARIRELKEAAKAEARAAVAQNGTTNEAPKQDIDPDDDDSDEDLDRARTLLDQGATT